MTPYLVYLLLIATLGPLQFGFHMVRRPIFLKTHADRTALLRPN